MLDAVDRGMWAARRYSRHYRCDGSTACSKARTCMLRLRHPGLIATLTCSPAALRPRARQHRKRLCTCSQRAHACRPTARLTRVRTVPGVRQAGSRVLADGLACECESREQLRMCMTPCIRRPSEQMYIEHMQIYVFSDKGSEAVSDLSVVTSHVIEEAVAEVLVNLAASVRSGFDGGCSADAFAEVQVSDFFAECFISNSAEGYTAETDAVAQA
eukprot:jgi/Ulvmu1/12516/UM090_0003.1